MKVRFVPLVLAGLAGPLAPAAAQVANDFPTEARADYVFACMAANGRTREVLRECSCSIDVIASILAYEDYVEAETILSIRRLGGEKTSMFRSAAPMREAVADLRRAQAEAEIRCFR
jgi:lysyl-tRNA synthetase class II